MGQSPSDSVTLYKCCAFCRFLRKMETWCSLWTSKIWTVRLWRWSLKGLTLFLRMGLWFSCVSPLKCIQATCIPRIERGVRSRVKIVRNGSRYALFSETKLQVCFYFAYFHIHPTFAHSLRTSFISKERYRAGRWSPSPRSCRWWRPWGTQWSRGNIPTLPSRRTLSLRNELWSEGQWILENGLEAYLNFWYLVNLLWSAVAKALLCICAQLLCLFCDERGFRRNYMYLRWEGRNRYDWNKPVIKESMEK